MADQTDPQWIDGQNLRPTIGTGIVVEGDPNIPFQYLPNITYPEFLQQVQSQNSLIEYKWVPHHVDSEQSLRTANCRLLPCNRSRGCVTPGCVCVDGICTKR